MSLPQRISGSTRLHNSLYSLLLLLLLLPSLSGCLVMRAGMGVSVATPKKRVQAPVTTAPKTTATDEDNSLTSFAFDLTLGLHIPLNWAEWASYGAQEFGNAFRKNKKPTRSKPVSIWLLPEMGFSLDHQAFPAKFHMGMGLSFTFPTSLRFGIGYIPSIVFGYSNASNVEFGFRNSLYLYALYFLSMEFQVELYPDSSGWMTNFRVLLGVDLLPVIGMIRSRIIRAANAREQKTAPRTPPRR